MYISDRLQVRFRAGIYGFLFSTIAITFLGEIFPQAYFSRNALKVASVLSPVIQFYRILLFKEAHRSGHKWVVLVDDQDTPRLVMDADGFLRSALLDEKPVDPYAHGHRPLIIEDLSTTLGKAMQELKRAQNTQVHGDDVLDFDVIVVWKGDTRRVITGADILGRLLKGIGGEPSRQTSSTNSSEQST